MYGNEHLQQENKIQKLLKAELGIPKEQIAGLNIERKAVIKIQVIQMSDFVLFV